MHMLWLALASHAFLSASPSIRARVAPPSIAATAEAEPVRMRVTVPAGVAAGDPLHVSTPAGELLIVTVPAGLQTGDPFDILVPALPPPPPPLSAAQAGGGDLPLVLSRAELERSQLPADAPEAGRFEELPLGPQLEPRGSIGERLGRGACILRVPGVVSSDEAAALLSAALSARSAQVERRGKPPSRGRARLPVSEPSLFGRDSVETCEEVLLRVLDLCDEAMPSLHETLFAPREGWQERQPRNAQGSQPEVPPPPDLAERCPSLRDLYMAAELEWSEGEPAINVYTSDGYFGAHKDHLALTVLIPLTAPSTDFEGGGTGFWAGNSAVGEDPRGPPDLVLAPAAGTALLFGGDVTHAGLPVAGGLRSVFVASFSTRPPASPPDRVHGLQMAPSVSPQFGGG
mmetsp:Transcript_35209/g.107903  ORF Transcript_35209/g.107903 Transcript_35209/m.107903 type:complete len:402 (+) Transcript_35209:165-1370(+)